MTLLRIFAVLLLLTSVGQTHSWYSGMKNPVTGQGCCGIFDCKAIEGEDVIREGDGYRWLKGPPGNNGWISELEVLPSRDHDYHACIVGGKLRCLLIPFSS